MWRRPRCNGNMYRKRPGTRRWRLRPTVDIQRSPRPHGPPRSTGPAWLGREERLLRRRARRWPGDPHASHPPQLRDPASPTGRRMGRGRPLPVRRTRRVFRPPRPAVSLTVAARRHTAADRRDSRGRLRPRPSRDRQDNRQLRNTPSSGRRRPRARSLTASTIVSGRPSFRRPAGRRSSMQGHRRIS
jgi:hypothetical protein